MDRFAMIRESLLAMESVHSVLAHNRVNTRGMDINDMIDKSLSITAPCHHQWKLMHHGAGGKKCPKCGGLQ